ncbi:helix-turn-helix domain-containing protein [Pediococcus pentosaceus]|uniref:helix-turn-helix domain-containing protein n=1 Tax=Pediococcus pentosaceus TaxID=1255 RepID=UPI0018FE443E|nr:helix-turn-helix transcriptional regulator [Pediococcus pentosaceus]MBF7122494.1 helix-turn-helix transcriptional regulator [Pediococcus pentosaceus]MBF7131615.1 helix-turn-helix transcriptional regulator [Pediococcus pentosaceus]MCS8563905.1 XRE family transcriptional regulator [Pediococcus pentosaceus]MCS8568200.1 XRE family transcriptional regulator [Pediococcus pentosaceus]MCS8580842.1 XRE family transcriptional regulator [Pediococcus pentosaceus]
MLRNRLAEILAERKLRISRVANDIPDLSRNTITSVAQNDGKMIQLNTINLLCQYLEISPSEFFEYLPFDISFTAEPHGEISKFTNDDFGTSINTIDISNLEFEGFLKKVAVNESLGYNEKTYDLTIRQTSFAKSDNPFELHGYTLIFDVLLGASDNTEIFSKIKDNFNELWNLNLTDGFKSIIKEIIISEINNKLMNEFSDIQFLFESIKDKSVKIDTKFNFSFEDAYSEDIQPGNITVLLNKQKKNSSIDISDDELPF